MSETELIAMQEAIKAILVELNGGASARAALIAKHQQLQKNQLDEVSHGIGAQIQKLL